jgi:hypothetical protein
MVSNNLHQSHHPPIPDFPAANFLTLSTRFLLSRLRSSIHEPIVTLANLPTLPTRFLLSRGLHSSIHEPIVTLANFPTLAARFLLRADFIPQSTNWCHSCKSPYCIHVFPGSAQTSPFHPLTGITPANLIALPAHFLLLCGLRSSIHKTGSTLADFLTPSARFLVPRGLRSSIHKPVSLPQISRLRQRFSCFRADFVCHPRSVAFSLRFLYLSMYKELPQGRHTLCAGSSSTAVVCSICVLLVPHAGLP